MPFLESLRLSNIFPKKNQKPFGMPDLNVGNEGLSDSQLMGMVLDEREKDRQLQRDLRKPAEVKVPRLSRPEQIINETLLGGGNGTGVGKGAGKGMPVVFSDQFGMSQKERERHRLEQRKVDIQERNADSQAKYRESQSANDKEKADLQKQNKDLTDSQRLSQQAENQREIQGLKDDAAMGRVEKNLGGRIDQIAAQVAGAKERAEISGNQVFTIPDPDKPEQNVGVRVNPRTGKAERLQLDNKPLVDPKRPGIDKDTSGEEDKEIQRMESMRTRGQELLTALDDLVDDKGRLKPEVQGSVGKSRMYNAPLGFTMPGGETATADEKINFVKSNMIMGLIGELKSQSRTGATGMGNMSDKDLRVLETAASKLNVRMSEPAFEEEIKRIREKIKLMMEPKKGTFKTTGGENTRPTAEELIMKHGVR